MKIDLLALGLAGVVLATLACGPSEPEAAETDAGPGKTGAAPAADIEAQLAAYPLETCVVSGEKLGSMGDPVDFVHEGRLVRLCCKMCVAEVEGDPDKFLAKLDDADGE